MPVWDSIGMSCVVILNVISLRCFVATGLQALGLEQGVLGPPHRLDVGTEGLVVLNKTPAFARWVGRVQGGRTLHAQPWGSGGGVTERRVVLSCIKLDCVASRLIPCTHCCTTRHHTAMWHHL